MTDTNILQHQQLVGSTNATLNNTIQRSMEFADDPYNVTVARIRTCLAAFTEASHDGDKFTSIFALNNLVQDASIMMMHLLEEIRKEEENEAV